MTLQDAIENVLRGNAILFVGSGFSLGAKNSKLQPIKSASELATMLCTMLGEEDIALSLTEAATDYYEKFGVQKLISLLKQEFSVRDTTNAQRGICSLNWRRIYTTNYDNVVEQSCLNNGKEITPVMASAPRARQNGFVCVHFNGYVDFLSPENNFFMQMRLPEESYSSRSIIQDEWFIQFREDVKFAKAVIFIGFSVPLNDIEISQLLFENQTTKGKCFFITGNTLSKREQKKLEKYGNVCQIGTDGFWEQTNNIKKNFDDDNPKENVGWALTEIKLPPQNTTITGPHIEDLLFKSIVRMDRITTYGYMIHRAEEDKIIKEIQQGADIILLCSDIADGKSILANQILARLSLDGIRIFSLHSFNELLPNELEFVGSLEQQVIIFVDNFTDYYSETLNFIKTKSDNITFLLTARRFSYDFNRHKINSDFRAFKCVSQGCSQLDDDALKEFCQRLDAIAGWGSMQGLSIEKKVSFLKGAKCNSKFSAILLALYEDPEIGKKIRAPYIELAKNREMQQLVISTFVLALIGASTNQIYDIITSAFGCRILDDAPETIRHYIDPGTGELRGSCSSIALYLMRHEHPDAIVDAFCLLVRYLKDSQKYKKLKESLITFGKIQKIFNEEKRFTALSSYYSSLQIDHHNDPLFWLQFAICKNAQHDFIKAGQYFDAAYSLAASIDAFKTFQLDNAYASFLLDRSSTLSADEAINDFFSAHSNVEKELRNSDEQYKYYPYRTAKRYLAFYKKHYRHLIPEHQKRFMNSCNYVLIRINRISDYVIESNRDVKECKNNLNKICYGG